MNRSLSVSLKYGLFIAGSLIAYFLILKLFHLHDRPWLRLANGLFMAAGIYFAIKYYKFKYAADFTYVDGFKTGLLTGFIATGCFIVFMAVYVFHLDTEFPKIVFRSWLDNTEGSGGIMILIVLMEGLASTAVLTLTWMQIFKKSQNIGQQEHFGNSTPKDKL